MLKKIVFYVALAIIALLVLGTVCSFINEARQVAQEEFGSRELLRKYEWFKDVSAQLDKKLADIQIYEQRFTSVSESYGSTDRKDWDRTDKEDYNLWQNELAGVKASYNSLAADYNSQMSKFNWSFCNAGSLPKGATVPLPREYKPYETK